MNKLIAWWNKARQIFALLVKRRDLNYQLYYLSNNPATIEEMNEVYSELYSVEKQLKEALVG